MTGIIIIIIINNNNNHNSYNNNKNCNSSVYAWSLYWTGHFPKKGLYNQMLKRVKGTETYL